MIRKNTPTTKYKEVTCPFCSLLCDDLVIQNHDGKIKVEENGCDKSIKFFERPCTASPPQIKGKTVSIEEAIRHAAKIIRQSKLPLIAGLGTDVSGMRSAMQLADRTGAIVDHMYSESAIRNIKVLQDHGWMMTTMAEIKNRADLIIFAGTNAIEEYPRFYERVINNKSSLFNTGIKKREIIYIGDKLDKNKSANLQAGKSTVLQCKQDQIGEIIAVIHALIVGNKLQHSSVAGIKLSILENIAERMKTAKYGVIVWEPSKFDFPYAELTIQALSGVIKYLNRSTRFAGFTLGGNDGGVTATNVSTWQCGYPLRVNFSNGFPEYDPHKYSTANVLKKKEVDSLIWISSFNSMISPPRAKIPTIVLAAPDAKPGYKPDVFIPTGTPGIDHAGHLFRTDNVIALPLRQIRDNTLMSVNSILKKIISEL